VTRTDTGDGSPIGPLTLVDGTSEWPACTWAITARRSPTAFARPLPRRVAVRCDANGEYFEADRTEFDLPWWTMG